ARRLLLGLRDPLDVFALVTRREFLERRAGFLVLRQRGGEIIRNRERFFRRLGRTLYLHAALVQLGGLLHVRRQLLLGRKIGDRRDVAEVAVWCFGLGVTDHERALPEA